MTAKIFELQAEICRALAHPKRLEILHNLQNGELSAGDLAKLTGLAKANLSQHLTILKGQELILSRRDGVTIYYRLANFKVGSACSLMREVLAERLHRQGELSDFFKGLDN